jgi:hypothetical protein
VYILIRQDLKKIFPAVMETLVPVIQSLFATASTRIIFAKSGDKKVLLKN